MKFTEGTILLKSFLISKGDYFLKELLF